MAGFSGYPVFLGEAAEELGLAGDAIELARRQPILGSIATLCGQLIDAPILDRASIRNEIQKRWDAATCLARGVDLMIAYADLTVAATVTLRASIEVPSPIIDPVTETGLATASRGKGN